MRPLPPGRRPAVSSEQRCDTCQFWEPNIGTKKEHRKNFPAECWIRLPPHIVLIGYTTPGPRSMMYGHEYCDLHRPKETE